MPGDPTWPFYPPILGLVTYPFKRVTFWPSKKGRLRIARWWGLTNYNSYNIYIYIYIPGTCLSSILGLQPSKTRSFPMKIEVIWVIYLEPKIYLYFERNSTHKNWDLPPHKKRGCWSLGSREKIYASMDRSGVHFTQPHAQVFSESKLPLFPYNGRWENEPNSP